MKKQVEIVVPTRWDDVSLKSYQKYIKKIHSLENEDDIILHSISTLCNVPKELVNRLQVKDVKQIYTKLAELISRPVNKEIFYRIEIKGVTYGFHPNLDEMSMGEYVDLDEYVTEGVDGLHYLLSILYRPIIEEKGNRYKIEPYTNEHINNAKHFREVSIDVVNGVMVFFYNLGTECLMSSKTYLDKLLEKNQSEATMGGLA